MKTLLQRLESPGARRVSIDGTSCFVDVNTLDYSHAGKVIIGWNDDGEELWDDFILSEENPNVRVFSLTPIE